MLTMLPSRGGYRFSLNTDNKKMTAKITCWSGIMFKWVDVEEIAEYSSFEALIQFACSAVIEQFAEYLEEVNQMEYDYIQERKGFDALGIYRPDLYESGVEQ